MEELTLMFRQMREEYGLSKNEMSNLLMVDRHTYLKIEKGLTTPYLSNFTALLSELGSNAFILYMRAVFPEHKDESAERDALAHYVRYVASDRFIHGLSRFIRLSVPEQLIIEDVIDRFNGDENR